MICRHSEYCKYFQSVGVTCNNDSEAKTHCGAYRQFTDSSEGKDPGDNIGNLFVVKRFPK